MKAEGVPERKFNEWEPTSIRVPARLSEPVSLSMEADGNLRDAALGQSRTDQPAQVEKW